MKKLGLLLIAFAILFVSCEEDSLDEGNVLRYDNGLQSGPLLPAGVHELAVRFTENELEPHIGKELNEVRFYLGQLPEECTLLIYGEKTNQTPGNILYTANLSNFVSAPNWNNFSITDPVAITGEDLWISIEVRHTAEQQSVGCDAGPNKANGDWLYRSDDPFWDSFLSRTGESVNWNIRGIVE